MIPDLNNGAYPPMERLVVARDRNGEENPDLYLLDPDGAALKQRDGFFSFVYSVRWGRVVT